MSGQLAGVTPANWLVCSVDGAGRASIAGVCLEDDKLRVFQSGKRLFERVGQLRTRFQKPAC